MTDELVTCPACLGNGTHDIECLSVDGVIVTGLDLELDCDECDATGLVTRAHARDIQAAVTAALDQIRARIFDEARREVSP